MKTPLDIVRSRILGVEEIEAQAIANGIETGLYKLTQLHEEHNCHGMLQNPRGSQTQHEWVKQKVEDDLFPGTQTKQLLTTCSENTVPKSGFTLLINLLRHSGMNRPRHSVNN
ncbi:hypothetical protein PsorP6_002348 [Peronosclerospora sorghi]|uniref:Uncharacterized protein n=1 Tax=Peronosclerospora sorghi TaxID=230839 RepID=A0ACC0WRR7_9STRA|nr:hypothetical protein PsorP6_002348 [Peronosclerospora sorghi]